MPVFGHGPGAIARARTAPGARGEGTGPGAGEFRAGRAGGGPGRACYTAGGSAAVMVR
ncbi:hypothetical protein GCM10010214_32030 [Streptomyces abikoensis]|nr:hypothetical protein GCM10010214_32030 [Streptomyces abikoensis]